MEREAFARARRFLSYSPVAKWIALTAAVGTGIFYVALLVVLGLFADLIVSRGEIPAFRNLALADQEAVFRGWNALATATREQSLLDIGAEAKASANLTSENLHTLPLHDQELLWRAYVFHLLGTRVSMRAADSIKGESLDQLGALRRPAAYHFLWWVRV